MCDMDAVVSRVSKEAARVSGLHFELYEANFLRGLRAELDKLDDGAKLALQQQLIEAEIEFDDAALAAAELEERDCLDEIARETV